MGKVSYLIAGLCWFTHLCSAAAGETNVASEAVVNVPPAVADPAEPVNRAIWGLNRGLMDGLLVPASRGYRFIVIKPVRESIGNLGKNIKYPGRLLNNLLEGNWQGAGWETRRFICNTLGGVGGLIDVTGNEIPHSDANFAQTFAQWGWSPHFFLMLPIMGPSTERDGLGMVGDIAANPLTYFSPYSYSSYGFTFNDLSDRVEGYQRLAKSSGDPYATMRLAVSFSELDHKVDWELHAPKELATLETLQSALFGMQDPEFPNHGKTRSVAIPATGKTLKYNCWIQPRPAPIVYILPGLGAHRLTDNVLGLAELAWLNGYSVVAISNPYNYEFMASASTAALPGYTPVDAPDALAAFGEIDRQLQAKYPGRLKAKALLGYSMGAFHTLYLAATADNPGQLQFDRYVGINTPVRLLYGVSKLDEFYRAPLTWPEAERTHRLENTLSKVVALQTNPRALAKADQFEAAESRFLIGFAFRFTLRDIIYRSQQRTNLGVLKQPLRNFRREALYQEIMRYSYDDYFQQFVLPYYQKQNPAIDSPQAMEKASDLRQLSARLKANPKVRVVTNENDFLLAAEDLAWLRETFGPDRVKLFAHGGHLGNLSNAYFQQAILEALAGLKATAP